MTILMNRRDFLRSSAVGVAGLTLGGSLTASATENPSPKLVVGRGPGIRKDLDGCLVKLLAPLGGMSAWVKKGQVVVLKPNLGFPNTPEVRATTSPTLAAAVVRLVQACGPKKIILADFPCRDNDQIMTKNGYAAALKGLPVEVLITADGQEQLFADVEVPQGRALKKAKVLKTILDADVHIALPVAKSHAGATFTGVLKGMMGVIFNREIFHEGLDLHQAIADLNTRIRPTLCILEGIEVMSDSGPVGPGTLVSADSLIAGTDPVAVDAAGVRLAPLFGKKVEPKQVKHLQLAEELKVGMIALPADRVASVEFA